MEFIEKKPIVEFITKGLNNPDKTKAYMEILNEIEWAPIRRIFTENMLSDNNDILKQYENIKKSRDGWRTLAILFGFYGLGLTISAVLELLL